MALKKMQSKFKTTKNSAISREDLMTFIQSQIDHIQDSVCNWVSLVDNMMAEFIEAKNEIE